MFPVSILAKQSRRILIRIAAFIAFVVALVAFVLASDSPTPTKEQIDLAITTILAFMVFIVALEY